MRKASRLKRCNIAEKEMEYADVDVKHARPLHVPWWGQSKSWTEAEDAVVH